LYVDIIPDYINVNQKYLFASSLAINETRSDLDSTEIDYYLLFHVIQRWIY